MQQPTTQLNDKKDAGICSRTSTASKKTPHRSAATLGDNTKYYSFYNTPHRSSAIIIELSCNNNATPVQYTKY